MSSRGAKPDGGGREAHRNAKADVTACEEVEWEEDGDNLARIVDYLGECPHVVVPVDVPVGSHLRAPRTTSSRPHSHLSHLLSPQPISPISLSSKEYTTHQLTRFSLLSAAKLSKQSPALIFARSRPGALPRGRRGGLWVCIVVSGAETAPRNSDISR
ncbi:hypothetical protein B0H16DRAFT_1894033 [Mycena metata]|uniref:Uncharacterized protein n=1 Tax=Mycena metata TaxID=1033252 RepID=A0AAD7MRH1_9AGAR|nr:hypothetical protein B0H16DRAFT_1894033 [Mycena metata]